MLGILQGAALILTAFTWAPLLAHALELPGKLRLGRSEYMSVQPIYYPGFTWAGAAEPVTALVLVALLWATGTATPAFWLTLLALLAAIATHAVFWIFTQPVNRFWLADTQLSKGARTFFGTEGKNAAAPGSPDWTVLRDRWERSHLIRAATSGAAFVLVVLAVVI